MFERLNDTFSGLFRKLSGSDKISEKNVADAMDDVRTALLDADVQLDVVENFTRSVMEDAVGRQVTKSLQPGQEMIGIVHDRLVQLLGGTVTRTSEDDRTGLPIPLPKAPSSEGLIVRVSPPPTVIMMCGLQGSGKTTTTGKVAAYLKQRGRSVMLAACDLQRPAAVEQLRIISEQVKNDMPGGANVSFYAEPERCAEYGKAVGVAVDVARRAVEAARKQGIDTVILDTAGRLHVNDDLMRELAQVKFATTPHHVLLVVDAMTGQDAVRSGRAFHDALSVDGVVLTKFDSDTRGGAALSIRHVTGAPIKFVGVGEKLAAIEEFHADRIAGRILGMGDVVSLVEKAQREVTDDDAKTLQDKMAKGEMTMDDFLKQLRTLRRMGPLKQLLGLIPGLGSAMKDVHIEDKELDKIEAMIQSMTRDERAHPGRINFSRKRRIARGSGTKEEDVGKLAKQFEMVSKVTRDLATLSGKDRAATLREMGPGATGTLPPGMRGLMGGRGSSAAPAKPHFKKRKK